MKLLTTNSSWAVRSLSRRNSSDTARGVMPARSSKSPFSDMQFAMSAAPIIVNDCEGTRERMVGDNNTRSNNSS
jgi:hypothetical protein